MSSSEMSPSSDKFDISSSLNTLFRSSSDVILSLLAFFCIFSFLDCLFLLMSSFDLDDWDFAGFSEIIMVRDKDGDGLSNSYRIDSIHYIVVA